MVPVLLSRATLALGNFPPLNERQQTGIGLVMDRVGLRLINVHDSNHVIVEVTCFDHLGFGFVARQRLQQSIECHVRIKMT